MFYLNIVCMRNYFLFKKSQEYNGYFFNLYNKKVVKEINKLCTFEKIASYTFYDTCYVFESECGKTIAFSEAKSFKKCLLQTVDYKKNYYAEYILCR